MKKNGRLPKLQEVQKHREEENKKVKLHALYVLD